MEKIKSEKVMLGITDVMARMGIGRDRAYEIIKRDEFHSIRVGRRYLVHEAVFDKWLQGTLGKNKQ